MKAPPDIEPEALTVFEILQHVSEIVSRMPLALLLQTLRQHRDGDPHAEWYGAAIRLVESAQLLELDGGKLSALEARTELTIKPEDLRGTGLPDDWAAR